MTENFRKMVFEGDVANYYAPNALKPVLVNVVRSHGDGWFDVRKISDGQTLKAHFKHLTATKP